MELSDLAFQQPPVRREALRAILRLLEPYEESIFVEELLRHLPDETSSRTLELLLGELLRREQIIIRNSRVRRRWPTALEFAEHVSDQRQRGIHYDISLEEFRLAFDEPEETYRYLEMVRPKGERRPIRELLEDETVSVSLRRKAERAVYRQYVTIDGVRVLKGRQELVRYAVRTLCRDSTGMDEFSRSISSSWSPWAWSRRAP